MRLFLLIDFGSTYTKITAVDLDDETVLGCAQSETTIDTDIMFGLNKALHQLRLSCGADPDEARGIYACSSAAGGLKLAAIGLTPSLTLEAASRAALGAGAKVISARGFELDQEAVADIESKKCDIVLLCGGTDGGNRDVILHNAKALAQSGLSCPILVAGNSAVSGALRGILEAAGKQVYVTKNVLPALDTLDTEPAQSLIREIFIRHIVKAKGLEKARDFVGSEIVPTPKASLLAASLLADGTASEPGIGSLLVVEIGGATINVHSVADVEPVTPLTVVRGLPESRLKRTVEGDLGIRWNAHTIYELAGQQKLADLLLSCAPDAPGGADFKAYTDMLCANVGHTPTGELEYNMDVTLGKCAAGIAVERHAGALSREYGANGEIFVQHGKNLLNVKNVIGTGGIFKYGLRPEQILKAAASSDANPWSLKPRSPRFFLDSGYILYGIGLLSGDYPEAALRMAKKYLRPATVE
ncbi:conserved hypothetical protein [Sporobacter termitidis DSM 10068]|uniref:MutL protein n=1 Tax=Sporobacter termitidis DSM 10068 TaxID=1123282 RepID=A0A1M5XX31_9FIRM|nr:methylaspartate mutase accessory protein GlmL [Sporobacter termitidis]SHI04098.1 conserved hypothetical protein [Sporobacter termitidis DSM 10068]